MDYFYWGLQAVDYAYAGMLPSAIKDIRWSELRGGYGLGEDWRTYNLSRVRARYLGDTEMPAGEPELTGANSG